MLLYIILILCKKNLINILFQPNSTTPITGSVTGSPRRFANQGLVYLSEIQTLEDVQELSVKQAKDILAMNRVNFKGVVEKDELLKHVARLWKQEHKAQQGNLYISRKFRENLNINFNGFLQLKIVNSFFGMKYLKMDTNPSPNLTIRIQVLFL